MSILETIFSYEFLDRALCLAGGILSGILFGLAIAWGRNEHRMKKLDAIRPSFDPNNPINQRSGHAPQRGEKDEYGFIRLW